MATAVATFGKMPFHERFGEVTTPVLLFGAGHVGRAVVLALAPLPFTVRWIDSRPDQFPQYVPQNVVTVCTEAATRELAAGAARCHDHRHDALAPARFRHHRRGAAAARPSISSA